MYKIKHTDILIENTNKEIAKKDTLHFHTNRHPFFFIKPVEFINYLFHLKQIQN